MRHNARVKDLEVSDKLFITKALSSAYSGTYEMHGFLHADLFDAPGLGLLT